MTEDHVAYALAHWRVTEDGLAWVPCGPDCTHEREPDVTGVQLTSIPISADQIIWVGECDSCDGSGLRTVHGGGSGDPEWDADDQPCPECNPNYSRVKP